MLESGVRKPAFSASVLGVVHDLRPDRWKERTQTVLLSGNLLNDRLIMS